MENLRLWNEVQEFMKEHPEVKYANKTGSFVFTSKRQSKPSTSQEKESTKEKDT